MQSNCYSTVFMHFAKMRMLALLWLRSWPCAVQCCRRGPSSEAWLMLMEDARLQDMTTLCMGEE
jgi:hypothetical protein